MEVKNQTKMKKGITLIEIILAIVLIAIILGITIPKLMSNSTKAEMKQVITSDLRSIVEAASTWRRSSSAAAGNYQVVSSGQLFSRLPSTMAVSNGIIYSSGLNVGTVSANGPANTGVNYTITWQFDPTNDTDTGRFSIGMDLTEGASAAGLAWNANLQQYAIDTFNDVLTEMSNNELDRGYSTATNTSDANGVANIAYDCSDALITCAKNIRTN